MIGKIAESVKFTGRTADFLSKAGLIRSAVQFLDLFFRKAFPASIFLAGFVDARFSFRADAGEDWLMKFGITDVSSRMNDAALAALWGRMAVRLSVYRLHLRHLVQQTLQAC